MRHPHAPVEPVHGVAVQPTQRRRLQSRKIGGDVAHDLADLGLRNPLHALRIYFSLPCLALCLIQRGSARHDPKHLRIYNLCFQPVGELLLNDVAHVERRIRLQAGNLDVPV